MNSVYSEYLQPLQPDTVEHLFVYSYSDLGHHAELSEYISGILFVDDVGFSFCLSESTREMNFFLDRVPQGFCNGYLFSGNQRFCTIWHKKQNHLLAVSYQYFSEEIGEKINKYWLLEGF